MLRINKIQSTQSTFNFMVYSVIVDFFLGWLNNQEYVDHGSLLFKFYVLGDKVFYAIKKSMPNASVLVSSSEKSGFPPLQFNR